MRAFTGWFVQHAPETGCDIDRAHSPERQYSRQSSEKSAHIMYHQAADFWPTKAPHRAIAEAPLYSLGNLLSGQGDRLESVACRAQCHCRRWYRRAWI